MPEHSASVIVNAPVHQVYELYSHFNDYPKFMTFVKEVTYLDDQRSHWVVDVMGHHAWDAVNENWVADRQIGWRAVDGLANSGMVRFEPVGTTRTQITVDVRYDPPAGIVGRVGEILGAGGQFERRLQHDLSQFATMVEQAPPGALDPTSSSYLFHSGSAASQGRTTRAQDESMGISADDRATVDPAGGATRSTTAVTAQTLGSPEISGSGEIVDDRPERDVPPVPGTSTSADPPN